MVNPTVTLVYKYSLFPSVWPVCDLRDDFFCIQRRQEQFGKAEEEKYAHQRNTKDNSIFRVVEFKYAYIVYYKEVYNVDRKRQMYSTITFSADIIMIGDAYLSNQW